jgi:hypothetical protein
VAVQYLSQFINAGETLCLPEPSSSSQADDFSAVFRICSVDADNKAVHCQAFTHNTELIQRRYPQITHRSEKIFEENC